MKKMIAVLGVVGVLIGALWAWPTRVVKASTLEMGAAQQTVQDFAPWLSAIILQKVSVANRLYPMERSAQDEVEAGPAAQVYTRFSRLDDMPVSLIGGRVLGDHIGTLLFTVATEHGPVGFKLSYFRFGTETRIGRVEIAGHWTELEAMALTVDLLPTPVTAQLQSKPQ